MVVGFSSGLRACSNLTVVFEHLDTTSWGGTFTGAPMKKKLLLPPNNREALERSELIQQDASSSGE